MLEVKIQSFNLLLNFSSANILIFIGMLTVTLINNINIIKNSKTIIIGNLYLLFTGLAIFAEDFFSIFFAFEMMMICASLLLFQTNAKITKEYFLTHFFTGSLTLVAIILFFLEFGDMQIINITYFFTDSDKYIIGYLLLIAFMVNIASFPFCGWMLNAYSNADNSSFLYLITFTTNASLLMVNKLFAGLWILKFFGAASIIYGSIYAYKEINYKRIFCYINIITFGMLLIVIAQEQDDMSQIIVLFMFISILYKALFGFSITMSEEGKISKSLILICSIFSMIMIISLPFTASFFIKTFMTNKIEHDIYYYIIYFGKIVTTIVLLEMFYQLYITDISKNNNYISQICILSVCFINIYINIDIYSIANYLNINNEFINFEYREHINSQLTIIFISLIISFLTKNKIKFITMRYEVDFFKIINYIYKKFINKIVKYNIDNYISIIDQQKNIFLVKLKDNILYKYKFNQKDSIMIVILLLISFMIIGPLKSWK